MRFFSLFLSRTLLSLPRWTRRGWNQALLGLLVSALLPACDLINPDEEVPAYVRIEPFTYTPGVMGAPGTSHITDAWLYADNRLIGVFELPATVPILRSGTVKLTLKPGIYADGQRGLRFPYPFYTSFLTTQVLTPGQVTPLQPAASFDPTLVRDFGDVSDDFETANPADRAFEFASTMSRYTLESAVVEGGRAGVGRVMGIPGLTDAFFLDSRWKGPLEQGGAPIYLELDYRSTMPFQVGVAHAPSPSSTSYSRVAELTVFPKQEWTKLYVNLTDEVSYVNRANETFKVYISGQPTGDAGQFLAFDNIRLVRPR